MEPLTKRKRWGWLMFGILLVCPAGIGHAAENISTIKDGRVNPVAMEEHALELLDEIDAFYAESGKLLDEMAGQTDAMEKKDVAARWKTSRGKIRERRLAIAELARKLREAGGYSNRIPERWQNRIVVGIDESLYSRVLEYNQIEKLSKWMEQYLQRHASMPVELWKLRPEELAEKFQCGEVDIVATDNPAVCRDANTEGILTVSCRGKTDQCCLLVTNVNSDIKSLNDVAGKHIAVLDPKTKAALTTYFGRMLDSAHLSVAPNNRAARMGLQMGEYDALIGFENSLGVSENRFRIVARSWPVPNAPLLVKWSENPEKNRDMTALFECLRNINRERNIKKILPLLHVDAVVDYAKGRNEHAKEY